MVGKLIKHELHSTLRVAAIPAIITILLAVLSRIFIETSSSGLAFTILAFYLFSIFATLLFGYFFGISSFYQSLFTGNGYLTLSLPVTPDQLIWSKLISAIIVMFASIMLCCLSACIFFIGMPQEMLERIINSFEFIGETISKFANGEPLFFVEVVISMIISIPMSFLVFYAVMSVGQLFTVKNRKAISILLYIGLMFVWTILNQTIFADINRRMIEVSIHLSMWVQIVLEAAVTVGCYFLVRYIIKNKINLLA